MKVEIGGDVNSTEGTEPSIARTREEFTHPKPAYFNRGYEWWMMEEAKKRNSTIVLDVLQWGAPGWIGDGKFFSQDNADYMIRNRPLQQSCQTSGKQVLAANAVRGKQVASKLTFAKFHDSLVPKGFVLSEADWHIWCNAPMLDEQGKVHLFVSRWPVNSNQFG